MHRTVKVAVAALLLVPAAGACSSGSHGYKAGSLGTGVNPVYGRSAAFSAPVTDGHVIEPETAHTGPLPGGYTEEEFFASGTATAFQGVSEPTDGRWSVRPSTSAPYTTRVIGRRPSDPKRFNGTVVVEWMNVSAGESNPDWDFLNPELADAGFAYVGVSAQSLGVQGGQSLLGTSGSSGLVQQEPARYGHLHHPGDQYALDMFAQIGRGLRLSQNSAVLGGLRPTHLVAVGESQSAFYLTTFVNAVQPITHAYDGFFIHSRGGTGAPLSGGSIASGSFAGAQDIRTDLNVPVFMFETETDLVELGYASAQQPNTNLIRTWEVPGTAHADTFVVGSFASSLGCPKPINDGPQHVVVQAAFASFYRWVASGKAPPAPPPLELTTTAPATLKLDSHGNALGGVRTPAVDVPTSVLSGVPVPGAKQLCVLFGSTTAYSSSQLSAVYHDRSSYLSLYSSDLDQAIRDGYILSKDRASLLQQAEQVAFSS